MNCRNLTLPHRLLWLVLQGSAAVVHGLSFSCWLILAEFCPRTIHNNLISSAFFITKADDIPSVSYCYDMYLFILFLIIFCWLMLGQKF